MGHYDIILSHYDNFIINGLNLIIFIIKKKKNKNKNKNKILYNNSISTK